MKGKSLSRVRLLVTPWTAAYQAPLSMGFSRQEYWSGVPLPSSMIRDYYEQLQGFPGGSEVKNPAANAGVTGDTDSIPGLGRYPEGGNATHSGILA